MKALSFLADYPRQIGGLLAVAAVCLLHVFTVHGLLVALFLESGEDLLCPTATRILWWLIFGMLGWVQLVRLTWREGRLLLGSRAALFAAALIDGVRRVSRRVSWWRAGLVSAAKQVRAERDRRAARERLRDLVPEVSGTVRASVPTPVDDVAAAA